MEKAQSIPRIVMAFLVVIMVNLTVSLRAQNPITLDYTDAPLTDVFHKLEKSTDYKFQYSNDDLRGMKTTVHMQVSDIRSAVKAIIGQHPLDFSVKGEYVYITLKKKQRTSAASAPASGPATIMGQVFDLAGETLPGVSVTVKGSPKSAAVTDLDGYFTLVCKDAKKPVLVFRYVGMQPLEMAYEGKKMEVFMEADENMFDDVVVTGYQVVDKRASTSAITSIKAEDLLRPDAMSIDQMLEGRVPDLMFMSNSGEAGVTPRIRIRGTSSIIGNREPLWVVDGIVVKDPVPISPDDLNDPDYINRIGNAIAGLNPQDIERLDVLKDASATALYGTKAANGVIVVTTKRGKEGTPTIRYTDNFTWKRRPRYSDRSVDVLNSRERIDLSRQLYREHYVYDDRDPLVGFELLMSQLMGGKISQEQFDTDLAWYETVNTDWFDLLTHDSFSQAHTLTLSGGGQRSSYYASLGFTDNDDIVKDTKNKRYNAMINLDVNFASWLTASFSLKGTVGDREYYQSEISPVQYAYRASRAIPAYGLDGHYYYYDRHEYSGSVAKGSRYYNVLNELENSNMTQKSNQVSFDANFRFKITDWLSANAIFSYTASHTGIDSYWGAKSYQSPVSAAPTMARKFPNGAPAPRAVSCR